MPKTAVAFSSEPKPRDLRNAVHLVTQKKGGVGKSAVAQMTAEFLGQSHGRAVCYDTDPSQPTFARVGRLNVRTVPILKNDEIDPMLINPMLNEIMGQDGPFVVDTGSSSYHALWNYIVGAGLFDLLGENDRPIVVHVPLAPQPDLEDTLSGFDEIAKHCPDRSIVVWLNEREHPIEVAGADFLDLKVAERNETKILSVILNKKQRHRWNRQYVGDMLKSHSTFEQALETSDTITRSYLSQVRREIFEQLEGAGL